MIRIVEGETFDKSVADIIAKTEPEKLVKVGDDEYAYERHIVLNKLDNGKYQYTITTPDGKVVLSDELLHPLLFPKKVTYFSDAGVKSKKMRAFVNISGEEVQVKREFNSFLKVNPRRKTHKVVLTDNPASADGNYLLDIFLNETDTRKHEPDMASGVFAAYLTEYATKGENILFDTDDYVSHFTNDEFFEAVKKEERRRWADQVKEQINDVSNLKEVKKLDITNAYLERKRQIQDYRIQALAALNSD